MRVQPVISEADAEANRHPVEHDRHEKVGPGEKEEGGNGQNVKRHHDAGGQPVQGRIRILSANGNGLCAHKRLLGAYDGNLK
jgi:hypothetical protein